jgi:PhnB protein
MKTGIEIDMVVKDSLKAFETYKKIFKAEEIEATNYEKGLNEVVFTIEDTRFHMLDENHDYQLFAPEDKPSSVWFNMIVEDIDKIYQKTQEEGFQTIQQ